MPKLRRWRLIMPICSRKFLSRRIRLIRKSRLT